MLLYHVVPIDRCYHCRGSSTPEPPAHPRRPPRQERRPTRSCLCPPKRPAKMAPRVLFFFFLRYEGEIPRPREVEIPLRTRRLWLRPPQQGDSCQLTFRAFSRPKWRGCSPFFFRCCIQISKFASECYPSGQEEGTVTGSQHTSAVATWPRPEPLGG